MSSDITGPALDIEEANEILALMREPKWQAFVAYLTRIKIPAEKKLRKLNNTPEENGYWKGVTRIIEDIMESIPEGLAEQIEAARKSAKITFDNPLGL